MVGLILRHYTDAAVLVPTIAVSLEEMIEAILKTPS
jgi:hypothetical protein